MRCPTLQVRPLLHLDEQHHWLQELPLVPCLPCLQQVSLRGTTLFSILHLDENNTHYCIWMNSILMIYGVVAGATIFLTEIDEKSLFEATFVNSITNERLPASSSVLVNYFLHHFLELVFVTVLCTVSESHSRGLLKGQSPETRSARGSPG